MASVPTDRSKPLKGTIKGFLNASTVLLQGPVGKNGLPLEKTIYLNGISAPALSVSGETLEEPLGFVAREFMRKAYLTHKVEFFIEQMIGNHEYGSIFDNGVDIAVALLESGFAKVVTKKENFTLKPFNAEKYKAAEEKAKNKKVGLWSDPASQPKRVLENLSAEKLFTTLKDKFVKGIIEEFNGSAFTIFSEELKGVFKFHLNGLTIPPFNFKNIQETKAFVEERYLQREVSVHLEKIDAASNVFLGDLKYQALDLPRLLLLQGLAKLSQEAATDIDNTRFHVLKEAMEQAREQKLRIWKEHKPTSKNSKKNETSYNGKVIEVHSGDSISVQNVVSNEIKRVFLANIRAPALGNSKKGEPEKPWSFESKEFLRTTLVGKKVRVEIEYSKTIQPKEREEEAPKKPSMVLEFGTLFVGEKNVSELLLENGLANVQMPRMDEDFTKYIKNLKEAEEKGKESKRGLFSSKEKVVVKFSDLSIQKNASKIKAFYSFIQGEKKLSGVVELILNGSRFKLRLNSHNSYLIFALQGIKCLPNDSNIQDYAEFSNKALLYSKENLLQRDVEVEIESCDNKGTILGNIILGKKNYSLNLLENGLAYVSGSGKTASRYQSAYEAAEKEAKANQVGIWKTGIKLNEGGFIGSKPKEINEKAILTCCDITNAQEFYLQDGKSKTLHIIESILKSFNDENEEKLKQPVKPGTPCVSIFLDDGKWYRAKVERHVKGDKYLVFFMDYGNYDEVVLDDIRKMPSKIMNYEPQAKLCSLAYVNTPGLDHDLGEEVANWLKETIWNKEFNVEFVYQIKEKKYAILRDLEEKDPKKSVNLDAVVKGYAKLSNEVVLPSSMSYWQEEEEKASGKVLGLWGYDDEDEEVYND